MDPYLRVLKSGERVDRHHYDRQTVKVVGGNFAQGRSAIKALSKPLLPSKPLTIHLTVYRSEATAASHDAY